MKRKKKQKNTTEFLLLPRLRYMGYSLILFSVCFFFYAISITPQSHQPPSLTLLPEEELSAFAELSPHDTFNFFAISSLFGTLGALCLFTSRKKLKSLKKNK